MTVLKIDRDPKLGVIVHVAVAGVRIKNPHRPDGVSKTLPHIPMTEDAMDKSVIKMVGEKEQLPDYQQGYNTWRKSFDSGRGGVFSTSIAEAVSFVEGALNK